MRHAAEAGLTGADPSDLVTGPSNATRMCSFRDQNTFFSDKIDTREE